MLRYKFKAGDRVGVVGIGGLGHLAIMFASKLGCEVTAFSRNESKKEEALQLGAKHYVATSDEGQLEKAKNSLDFLIVTSPIRKSQWSQVARWMDLEGRIVLLSLSKEPLVLPPFLLNVKNLSVTGSLIGSIDEIKTMLQFAAEHQIYPIIQKYDMKQVNVALNHMRNGEAKYRIVLANKL
ncbi:NAD(P)-binding protein [Neoconidiobolus thromboides FSU 785]|nr:NAD(P)-binding protein [Neoconidiobolus thromboides FSU 785]